MNQDPISVVLATEGTYPFYGGGVSTWCHRLTHGLTDIEFSLLAVATSPYPQAKYDLAPNVRTVIKVPQWGLLQPAEYSHHQPTSMFLRKRWNTSSSVVSKRFKPLFEEFFAALFSSDRGMEQFGSVLLNLQTYFQSYDYERSMNSVEAWEVLQHVIRATRESRPPATQHPTLAEVKEVYRLLYHLLMVLHFPIPTGDVVHSSAASFCGLPCVLAKIANGTPYLLTEHGVYLREQYLNLRRYVKSFFVRWFLYLLVEKVVELNYCFADQICPVCAYNARWERRLGVPEGRIEVIFNGVSPETFRPWEREARDRPLVSTVGLIYPLKGQLDLIQAMGLLKPRFEDLEMRFYGAASHSEYFGECVRKVSELHLEKNVNFCGTTKEPWKAFSNADVVAFPSISEAFPYVVVEAMLCGAAIVATDVGGIKEALGNCGLLVPPKKPQAMSEAISFLLTCPQEREALGRRARARALENFTDDRFLGSYRATYYRLSSRRVQRYLPA
ncbi:MAG: GT4 family glycosyltransferase PelF [Acidobacteriia bacterium]|nr:GT4 family glycosyltransferase PelF [Terriglobia bacterium]